MVLLSVLTCVFASHECTQKPVLLVLAGGTVCKQIPDSWPFLLILINIQLIGSSMLPPRQIVRKYNANPLLDLLMRNSMGLPEQGVGGDGRYYVIHTGEILFSRKPYWIGESEVRWSRGKGGEVFLWKKANNRSKVSQKMWPGNAFSENRDPCIVWLEKLV